MFTGTLGSGLESYKGDPFGERGSYESDQKPGARACPGQTAKHASHTPHSRLADPRAPLGPSSLATCKPSPCVPSRVSPTQLPSAQAGQEQGPSTQIIVHPGSDLRTLRNLISQRISFPFMSGNWRVRLFSEHSLFIFPRFKGGDRGNGVRCVLYSSRGQNKQAMGAGFCLNKDKLTPKVGCPKVVSILLLEVFNRNCLPRLSSAGL